MAAVGAAISGGKKIMNLKMWQVFTIIMFCNAISWAIVVGMTYLLLQ